MNAYPYILDRGASLARVFRLFRTMGLRHIVVGAHLLFSCSSPLRLGHLTLRLAVSLTSRQSTRTTRWWA